MTSLVHVLLGTLTCLVFFSSTFASAEVGAELGSSLLRGGPRPVPRPPTYVDDNIYYSPGETYRDITLDLMSILDLSERRSLRELNSVIVGVWGREPNSAVTLLINGVVEAGVSPLSDYNSLNVQGTRLINSDIQQLQLRIDGSVHIQSIDLRMRYKQHY